MATEEMENRQIWPDGIQPVENLTFVHVDKTYVKVLMARLALIYVFIMAVALIIPLFADHGGFLILLVVECLLAAAFIVNVVLVRRIYAVRGYALRNLDISYRRGLFFTSVTTIPFCRIQQVSVRLNPLSRLFGLCYLDVVNGSQGSSNTVTIPGLTPGKADEIKSILINHADSNND